MRRARTTALFLSEKGLGNRSRAISKMASYSVDGDFEQSGIKLKVDILIQTFCTR